MLILLYPKSNTLAMKAYNHRATGNRRTFPMWPFRVVSATKVFAKDPSKQGPIFAGITPPDYTISAIGKLYLNILHERISGATFAWERKIGTR